MASAGSSASVDSHDSAEGNVSSPASPSGVDTRLRFPSCVQQEPRVTAVCHGAFRYPSARINNPGSAGGAYLVTKLGHKLRLQMFFSRCSVAALILHCFLNFLFHFGFVSILCFSPVRTACKNTSLPWSFSLGRCWYRSIGPKRRGRQG